MFHSARIKLTLWYLLIIIIITTLFSGGIYINISKEVERGFWRAQRQAGAQAVADRLGIPARDLPNSFFEGDPQSPNPDQYFLLDEDLASAKARLFWALVIVNAEIWVLAAVAGYFLAGKTLKPIARAMEDQQRFISDASHELRTPITALKTSLEVSLDDTKIPKYGKHILKENLEDVENLETLTNHLLDLVTPTELNSPQISELQMKPFLQNIVKKFNPIIKKNNQKLRVSIKPPQLSIETDELSLKKLLIILLDNAVKYTPPNGKIHIQVQQQKKRIYIKIKDTGIGISEKDLLHIFDRFYRADNARTRSESSGYGLGLPMAKKLVQQLKGKLNVSSEVGSGTTFTLQFHQKFN